MRKKKQTLSEMLAEQMAVLTRLQEDCINNPYPRHTKIEPLKFNGYTNLRIAEKIFKLTQQKNIRKRIYD